MTEDAIQRHLWHENGDGQDFAPGWYYEDDANAFRGPFAARDVALAALAQYEESVRGVPLTPFRFDFMCTDLVILPTAQVWFANSDWARATPAQRAELRRLAARHRKQIMNEQKRELSPGTPCR